MRATAVGLAPQKPGDLFAFLPQSNGIVVVDVRRLLDETLPRVFATDTDKLAQINSDIDKFRVETGVDPRALDRAVLGTRYTYPSANVTKLETVAIVQGKFDLKAIGAAGRQKAKENFREEKYRGATIMTFGINDQIRLFGLWNLRVRELAVSGLNGNTLAIGSPATVRAAIDAGRNKRLNNVELVPLATRDPQAVIGFGGNVLPALLAKFDFGMDAITKDLKSVRQVYGSIGSTNTDMSLDLIARTDSAAAAKNLNDTITGLKQVGEAVVAFSRMASDKKALAQSTLANLKITTRGNDLEIRTQVAVANLAAVVK
jgi:hypothetical protein